MNFNNQKSISILEIGDLFSFRKKSVVHMITRVSGNHIEYKSYNDGKIRVLHDVFKFVYTRKEFDRQYELKWFNKMH
jgi:hypothetical protein